MAKSRVEDTKAMITKKIKILLHLAFLCGTAMLLTTGCFSQTVVQIKRGPIQASATQRTGHILLKRFTDARAIENKSQIGGTPAPQLFDPSLHFRPVLIKEGENLADLLTSYFAEALKQAGYQVSVQPPAGAISTEQFDGIMEGEIETFLLAAAWNTCQMIQVRLRLCDPAGKVVLWTRAIRADHTKFIGLYNAREFEEVIQKALDKALAQAVQECASDDFQEKLKRGK